MRCRSETGAPCDAGRRPALHAMPAGDRRSSVPQTQPSLQVLSPLAGDLTVLSPKR